MKKLDNLEYISKKDLTQQECEVLIESMYDDAQILIEEYLLDLPENTVFEELLRCLTYNIYRRNVGHKEAFKIVQTGIDMGIMLWKDIKDEEDQWMSRRVKEAK